MHQILFEKIFSFSFVTRTATVAAAAAITFLRVLIGQLEKLCADIGGAFTFCVETKFVVRSICA